MEDVNQPSGGSINGDCVGGTAVGKVNPGAGEAEWEDGSGVSKLLSQKALASAHQTKPRWAGE